MAITYQDQYEYQYIRTSKSYFITVIRLNMNSATFLCLHQSRHFPDTLAVKRHSAKSMVLITSAVCWSCKYDQLNYLKANQFGYKHFCYHNFSHKFRKFLVFNNSSHIFRLFETIFHSIYLTFPLFSFFFSDFAHKVIFQSFQSILYSKIFVIYFFNNIGKLDPNTNL